MNITFIDAFLNLNSVKQLTLSWVTEKEIINAELRQTVFTKLRNMSLQCLLLNSTSKPGFRSIDDEQLFTLLNSGTVKCLHLKSLNHYVDRWLTNNLLHERASITNLCIANDQFGYNPCEKENKRASLFHSLADYRLLFPKLKYLCIGICIAQFDDNRVDSLLICYYLNNHFNTKVRLTVRLFHKADEIPSNRFDWVLTKLKTQQADIVFTYQTKREARITIKSRNGSIYSEIIICFDQFNVEIVKIKKDVISLPEQQMCVDVAHYYRGISGDCLCICNNN
jgi:hypothetical protein